MLGEDVSQPTWQGEERTLEELGTRFCAFADEP